MDVRTWSAGRLDCRPAAPDDLDDMIRLYADPAMTSHRPDPRPDGADACRARLAGDLAHWRSFGVGRWRIAWDGAFAGFAGLTHRPDFEGLNISFHVAPALQGRGVASIFTEGALALAAAHGLADQVYGLVRPANPASRRVLEKAGFASLGLIPLGGAPTERLVRAIAPAA